MLSSVLIFLLQSRPENTEGEARKGRSRRRRGSPADQPEEKGEEIVPSEEGQVGRVVARQRRRRQEGKEKAEKEGRLRRYRRHRYRQQ